MLRGLVDGGWLLRCDHHPVRLRHRSVLLRRRPVLARLVGLALRRVRQLLLRRLHRELQRTPGLVWLARRRGLLRLHGRPVRGPDGRVPGRVRRLELHAACALQELRRRRLRRELRQLRPERLHGRGPVPVDLHPAVLGPRVRCQRLRRDLRQLRAERGCTAAGQCTTSCTPACGGRAPAATTAAAGPAGAAPRTRRERGWPVPGRDLHPGLQRQGVRRRRLRRGLRLVRGRRDLRLGHLPARDLRPELHRARVRRRRLRRLVRELRHRRDVRRGRVRERVLVGVGKARAATTAAAASAATVARARSATCRATSACRTRPSPRPTRCPPRRARPGRLDAYAAACVVDPNPTTPVVTGRSSSDCAGGGADGAIVGALGLLGLALGRRRGLRSATR